MPTPESNTAPEAIIPVLEQDAEFCSDKKKTLEQWNTCPPNLEASDMNSQLRRVKL